jgi:hypothetical protein
MRTYLLILTIALGTAGVIASAAADKKQQHRYVGIHPIPKAHGGGVCHIEAPHVHLYAAVDVKLQYRDHEGWQHFVGDPVAYGWDGPKTSYYGHHPIHVDVVVGDDHPDVEYCYLEGPHYHAWAPAPDRELELRGGAYWYVGTFPPAYVATQATYDPIDTVYEPIHYARPEVVVAVAPPGWYGAVVIAPVIVVPAHVDDRPHTGVVVHVPAPTLRVEIGIPSVHLGIGGGVIIHDGEGHKHKHKHKHGRDHDD